MHVLGTAVEGDANSKKQITFYWKAFDADLLKDVEEYISNNNLFFFAFNKEDYLALLE